MKQGDKFNKKGYELVASIDVGLGVGEDNGCRVLVLHNHSSHYLIAISHCSTQIAADNGTDDHDWEGEEVEFAAALPYFDKGEDEQELLAVYKAALSVAILVAMGR